MISVCIPTYNGELFIKEQLDSILDQSKAVDEIIISDDSSTDNTIEIIRSYEDCRIKLFENQHFSSPIFNLEFALKQAKGDYIFLADQDDIWMENKVELLVAQLKTNKLVISDGEVIDQSGNIIATSIFEIFNSKSGFIRNFIRSSFIGCCMAFQKDLLHYILPFPTAIAMHDLWIGLNAELYTTPLFYSKKLIRYRRHGFNETPLDSKTNSNTILYKLSYRITLLTLIGLRFINRKLRLRNRTLIASNSNRYN